MKDNAKDPTLKKADAPVGNAASAGFSEEERAAMKERAKELKMAARRGSGASKADGEADVRAKIAEMPESDRIIAEPLHELIKANAPGLSPKTWYGMPAYANSDGKVVCFFRGAGKFKERYMTFGFNQEANLDDGDLWPVAFALTGLGSAERAKIAAMVKKAVS